MLLVPDEWKKLVPIVCKIFQNSPEIKQTRSGSSLACAGSQGTIFLQFIDNMLISLNKA
jgi:hypothetical protein